MPIDVRDYRPEDEESWLRLKILSFLHTSYFDAVDHGHETCPSPGFSLVAEEAGNMLGVLDVSIEGELATIDTVAVHPDHQCRGVGSTLLGVAARRAFLAGATTIDAWTRDDEATLRWYRSRGFTESDQYLHVYANLYSDPAEPERAVESTHLGLRPVIVFAHARLDQEEELRGTFQRVHVCRRFSRPLTP